MATLDEGLQLMLDQTALELAQARFAVALQEAGLIAIEVTDPEKFMNVTQMIATRTVADANANSAHGDAASWTEQAKTQLHHVVSLGEDSGVTVDQIKKHLKDGLEFITSDADWAATKSWVSAKLDGMLRDGTVRETEPVSDKGVIEIIFPEGAFPDPS